MKKEKAIKYIKSRCIGSAEKRDGTQWSDAMWTAIEALQNLSKPNNKLQGSDLISRQDAIKAVESKWYVYENKLLNDYEQGWNDACDCIEDEILESLPSAPDSRQRGEWVRLEREENVYDLHGVPTWGVNYMCDKCGFITTAIQDHFAQYKWCPSCGADMRGGEDE